jgi:glutamate formiminotransferase/formiminotetrahydrofolate cyclodeaminase
MRSDLEVGAKALEAGVWGCYRNVLTNLGDIEDAAFRDQVTEEAESLVRRAAGQLGEVLQLLEAR